MEYKKEILSVFDNQGVGIGFIARRYVIFGMHEMCHRWCAAKPSMGNLDFYGAYTTRKQAVDSLLNTESQRIYV